MLLTTNQLQEELQISRATVYRLIKKGLPYYQLGNSKRFEKNKVQNWINEYSYLKDDKMQPNDFESQTLKGCYQIITSKHPEIHTHIFENNKNLLIIGEIGSGVNTLAKSLHLCATRLFKKDYDVILIDEVSNETVILEKTNRPVILSKHVSKVSEYKNEIDSSIRGLFPIVIGLQKKEVVFIDGYSK